MIYTNVEEYGGEFGAQVTNLLNYCDDVTIASGYVSLDVIEKYAPLLEQVARSGGNARLLVGMAFYEGLTQKKLTRLTNLSNSLSSLDRDSGVYIPYKRKYHGKIYKFKRGEDIRYFVGSSNFSATGLRGNMEATAPIVDDATSDSIESYIEYLMSDEISAKIDKLEIIVPGSGNYKEKLSAQSLEELERYDPTTININELGYFDLDLERYADKMKSSLNVYFGEGRLNRSTNKFTPRSWYEIALIATADTIRNPLYPHGHFDALTDDGYVLPMAANGDNDKNIQSRGNLKLFGMWLKSKLQKSGALVPLTPITLDTLEAYGRTKIRFYKLSEGRYYIDFSVSDPSS